MEEEINEIKKEVKREDVCRLCLGDRPWLHIFDENFALAAKVESLCRFKMAPDDELPKYICSPCAETLDAAIAFRDRCEASDDRLRRQLHEPQLQNTVCNIDPLNLLVFSDKSMPKRPKKPKRATIDPVKPKRVRIRSVKPKSAEIRSTKPKGSRRTAKSVEICPFCGLPITGSFKLFEKHLATHKEKPFTCDDCDKSFVHKSHLISHIQSHRPSLHAETLDAAIAFRDRCEASDDRLRRQFDGPKLQSIDFNIDPLNLLVFSDKSKPKRPKKPKRATIDPVKPKRVRIRSEKPKSAGIRLTKPKGSRRNAKTNEICPFCSLTFIGNFPLFEKHLATHKEKPFTCDHCGRSYVHKKHLLTHMPNHSPSLQCEICGRRFGKPSAIRLHMDATHQLGDKLQCDICQSFFYRKLSLITHMVSHLGIKKFKCNLCSMRFASAELRDRHMKKHTGEKPFACKICGGRFAIRRTLTDHVKLHTGETPYHCPVCDKGFVQLSNMKSHFRNNHKGVPFIYQNKRTNFPRNVKIKNHVTYENDKEKFN